MASHSIAFDHIHLISAEPDAAADWYVNILGGTITDRYELRGAPQIVVTFGDATLLIRGQRPGENPGETSGLRSFSDFASHDQWGADHFGFRVSGDFKSFCQGVREKGGMFSVEPHEFLPDFHIAYLAAPDGVTVEIVEAK